MSTKRNERAKIEAEYRENGLPNRLLSINEVAYFLGVHVSTVRRWVKQDILKAYSIGLRHNLRFKQEDILHFLSMSEDSDTRNVSPEGSLDSGD